MGQGTLTGLAQLVAEELECDWNKVTTESITAGQNLARKRVWGEMGTGGSRGIRTSQDYVRRGRVDAEWDVESERHPSAGCGRGDDEAAARKGCGFLCHGGPPQPLDASLAAMCTAVRMRW